MLCETVREQLHTLSDGERLENRSGKIAVLAHCVSCFQCRAFRQQLKLLRRTSLSLPNTLAIPASLGQRIFALLSLPYRPVGTVSSSHRRDRTNTRGKSAIGRRTVIASIVAIPLIVSGYFMVHPGKLMAILRHEGDDHELNPAYIKRAEQLRAKWKPWAMAHKAELSAMLKESEPTHSALDRVQKLIPAKLHLTNNIAFTPDDMDAPEVPFAYLPEMNSKASSMTQIHHTTDIHRMRIVQNSYDIKGNSIHDVEILCSMKMGTLYTLWASGRITEKVQFGMSERYANSRELAPPYEELGR